MAWTEPADWTTGELVTASKMNTHVRDNLNAIAAPGDYKWKLAAATTSLTIVDGGWFECNGQGFTGATYTELRDVLSGLSFPFGGDATTPLLPDFRGRLFAAIGGTGGHADMDLGDNEGVSLSARRMAHKHTVGVTHNAESRVSPNATDPNNQGADHSDFVDASITVTVGPQTGSEPTDAPAYLVGGIICIKF